MHPSATSVVRHPCQVSPGVISPLLQRSSSVPGVNMAFTLSGNPRPQDSGRFTNCLVPYLSIHPPIYLSIYPSIHLSIHLSVYLPILLFTIVYLSIYLPTYPFIYSSISVFIIIYLSIYLPTCLPTEPVLHSSIHQHNCIIIQHLHTGDTGLCTGL